jgi:hypothetical protein
MARLQFAETPATATLALTSAQQREELSTKRIFPSE